MVAGEARGLRLDVPAGIVTRPTSDRVREAVFNALESLGAIRGARVIDAFAGSGALGIEALSRGADHVTFVELEAEARTTIHTNLAHFASHYKKTPGEQTLLIFKPAENKVLRIPLRFDPARAEIWRNGSSLLAGLKLLFGSNPQVDFKDNVAKVSLD